MVGNIVKLPNESQQNVSDLMGHAVETNSQHLRVQTKLHKCQIPTVRDLLRAHDRPRLHHEGGVQPELLQGLAKGHDREGEGDHPGPQQVRVQGDRRPLQADERAAEGK